MTTQIALRVRTRERVAAGLRGGALLALALFVLLRTLDTAFGWERWALGQAQLVERWTFFSTGLAISALIGAFSVPLLRPLFARKTRLLLEDDWMTIQRTGLLGRPIVVQHRDVRAVVTGDLSPLELGKGWLFPQLAAARIRPNLGLVFYGTVAAPGPIRTIRRWPEGSTSYLPLPRRRTTGLLLEVEDPDRAARELTGWADLKPLDAADLEPVKPSEYEWRSTRFRIYATYLALIVLASLHVFNVIANPLPDRCDARRLFCETPTNPSP
jgi:hypothetical protein